MRGLKFPPEVSARSFHVHVDAVMAGLAAGNAEPQTVMIDATYLKVHRTAFRLRLQKGIPAVCSTSLWQQAKSVITPVPQPLWVVSYQSSGCGL